MQNREKVRIWPIVYFQADWASKSYSFDLDIRLIRADKEVLDSEWGTPSLAFAQNPPAVSDLYDNTEWFLTLPVPKPTEHVSIREIGMSFENELQEAIVDSFLMCLRLIRRTPAILPVGLKAETVGDDIDPESIGEEDYYWVRTERPPVYMPQSFQLGDLQLLTELWASIIRLRKLDSWANQVYKEEFFAKLDKKAVEDAHHEFLEMLLSHPAADDPELKEALRSMARQAKNEGGEWWHKYYSECFRRAFKAEEDETFSNRTRIGRALNLFYEGLLLPKLHSFLSTCLVLETLFTIGKGETVHKFAVRLAKIVGGKKGLKKRKEIYKRAKKVYDERSDIVHGEKLIEAVAPEVLKDAFVLASQSLQHILLDSELLPLYSHPGTTDKKLKGKGKGKIKEDAHRALSDYFLNLDLSI